MNSKKVTIRGTDYRLSQAQTGWVFVWSNKTKSGFPIGIVVDGQVAHVKEIDATRYATNQELLNAYVSK